MDDRYFEDFSVGERFVSGFLTVTETEISQFRATYDGQLGDSDEAGVLDHHDERRVAASLAYVLAVSFRLFQDTGAIRVCGRGSPGVDQVRYHKPLRAGDSIQAVGEVTATRPSKSKPARGLVDLNLEVRDRREEKVLTYSCKLILAKRSPSP
jgi:acyl dehydratase